MATMPGNYQTAVPKKADIILKTEQEISAKQNELLKQCASLMVQVQELTEGMAQNKKEYGFVYKQNSEIYAQLKSENEALRSELLYLAKQSENIFSNLTKKLDELSDEVKKIAIRQEEGFGEPADDNVQKVIEEYVPAREVVHTADVDYERIACIVSDKLAEQQTDIDYEKIASLVSMREYISPDYIASKVAEQVVIPQPSDVSVTVDEEKIASLVAEKIVLPEVQYVQPEAKEEVQTTQYVPAENINLNIDEEELADRIALKVGTLKAEDFEILIDDEGCASIANDIAKKLDYDLISETVAEKLRPTLEAATADAEEFDYEEIARRISEKIDVNAINEDAIADKAAAVLSNYLPDSDELVDKITSQISDLLAAQPAPDQNELVERIREIIEENKPEVEIDSDALCNAISEKVIESQADRDYNIVIDDEGVAKISQLVCEEVVKENEVGYKSLEEKIDGIKQYVDETNASQLKAIEDNTATHTKVLDENNNVDYNIVIDDEGLNQISYVVSKEVGEATTARFEKIEDEIHALREYVESGAVVTHTAEGTDHDIVIDDDGVTRISQLVSDDVNKLTEERFEKLEASIEEIRNSISDGVNINATSFNENVLDHEHDIIIADEGVNKISELVSEDVNKQTAERFEKLEESIENLRKMISEGVVVSAVANNEIATSEVVYDENATDELVTVSEVVTDEEAKPEEEAVEEPAKQAEEDLSNQDEEIVTVSDIVSDSEEEAESQESDDTLEDIDEQLVDGEIMPDGIVGISNTGVDFANMMKYDRSFIARIIQGTDDQKGYYGAVKQALLSYKKVNSNVAWGSERFNKGRETIARFKIRGKTLCLYLALDPNDYKVSVYHHVDVTDNKSMHGTPMMVKIKSPLGVKKAIRLVDELLAKRDGIKRVVPERDYAAMYPYESIEELIEDGLVKDVSKNR
jgi:hypothetical protein